MSDDNTPASGEPKKRTMAGLLGLFLGAFGAHRFYLGDTKGGLIRLVISVCTFGAGGIVGIIEGIIYLTKKDDEWTQTYVVEKKEWF